MLLASALALPAALQAQVQPAPENVLQLQATGSVEVQQDLLALTLAATRDGADAGAVQAQLRTVLEAALAEAKRAAQPGQLDVRTGAFNVYPRYGRDGRINGWAGRAELVLEGRDFLRISQTAARLQGLTLAGVGFALSREQRARVEAEAQAQAIERFKARAAELARGFGFNGYTLREVSVTADEPGFAPRPRAMAMAMEAKAATADAAVPVEAGRSTVTVTVSGSVQLR